MVANEYVYRAMGHRDYGMTGVQFVINHQIGNHDLEYGFRRHKDYRSRLDSGRYQKWTIDGNSTMTMVNEGDVQPATYSSSGELKDTKASGFSSWKYSSKSSLLSKLALSLLLNSLPP